MKTPRTKKGFTLIELLVVIGIIALLASIALPAFQSVQLKAAQTKALNNAKQIGLACKTFAVDNNGQFPTYPMTGGVVSGSTQVTNSNDAFNDLIPNYLGTLQCFYQAGSFETPLPHAPADPDFTKCGSQTSTSAMPSGSQLNHWAYVTGMSDTSNSSYPLITDNPNKITTSAVTWTTDPTKQGGVWKAKQTIVVNVDDSASVETVNGTTYEDMNGPTGIDKFSTNSVTGIWMAGAGTTGNVVVPSE